MLYFKRLKTKITLKVWTSHRDHVDILKISYLPLKCKGHLIPFVYYSLKSTNFTIMKVVNCDWCIIKWCKCKNIVALITISYLNSCELCCVYSIVVEIKFFVYVWIYLRPQIKFWRKIHKQYYVLFALKGKLDIKVLIIFVIMGGAR